MLLTNSIIAITDFRKNPFMNEGEHLMAVMKNNKPEYYAVSPERLKKLLDDEAALNKIKNNRGV